MADKDVPQPSPDVIRRAFYSFAVNVHAGRFFPNRPKRLNLDSAILDHDVIFLIVKEKSGGAGGRFLSPVKHNIPRIPGDTYVSMAVFDDKFEARKVAETLKDEYDVEYVDAKFGLILQQLLCSQARFGLHIHFKNRVAFLDPINIGALLAGSFAASTSSSPGTLYFDEYTDHNMYPAELDDFTTVMEHMAGKEKLIDDWQVRGAYIDGRFANVLDVMMPEGTGEAEASALARRLYRGLMNVTAQLCIDLTDEGSFADRRKMFGPEPFVDYGRLFGRNLN